MMRGGGLLGLLFDSSIGTWIIFVDSVTSCYRLMIMLSVELPPQPRYPGQFAFALHSPAMRYNEVNKTPNAKKKKKKKTPECQN